MKRGAPGRVLGPEEGEVLLLRPPGRSGEVTVKADPVNTGFRRLAMGTQRLPPGARIPVHLHEEQEEVLFIHSGSGTLLVGSERRDAGPGTTACIPPGVWHGVENTGSTPLELVWVISPPGLEAMFRSIGAPPGTPAAPLGADEFRDLAARHHMRVLADEGDPRSPAA